jgi:small subunit ribosomal protein S16
MVKIRLARGGTKKKPYYRVVVADQRCKRDGRYLEHIGFYNPMASENRFGIDDERVKHWLSVGAQPTERVSKLMKQAKIKV